MATLPTSADLTGAGTTNAQQKLNLAAIRNFLADLLGTDSSTKPAARTALGLGDQRHTNGFRLTLTTGVPVTTADVTGASTIYACPYRGNEIALYSAAGAWTVFSSAQFSIALAGLTSGRPYDVFCYDNAGVPTLEVLAWTNDTARATALAFQDGVVVKSGAATRRYLGTFYTTGATTTEDSLVKRYLWNYYHRARRAMKAVEATDSWTYSTAAWRQANASAANQLNFVIGVDEDAITAAAVGLALNSTATARTVRTGIGLDSTAAFSGLPQQNDVANTAARHTMAMFTGSAGIGRHYLAWLEYGGGADTQTWYGDVGTPAVSQQGIQGEVLS